MNAFLDYFDYHSNSQETRSKTKQTCISQQDEEMVNEVVDDDQLAEVMDEEEEKPNSYSQIREMITEGSIEPRISEENRLESRLVQKAIRLSNESGSDEGVDYYTNFANVR